MTAPLNMSPSLNSHIGLCPLSLHSGLNLLLLLFQKKSIALVVFTDVLQGNPLTGFSNGSEDIRKDALWCTAKEIHRRWVLIKCYLWTTPVATLHWNLPRELVTFQEFMCCLKKPVKEK